ncbi:MAG: dihydropteroate synthase [Nitrospirales bacterium]
MVLSSLTPDVAILKIRDRILALHSRPLIMGVVNVTPDSFSDGGRYLEPSAAVAHAETLVAEGADLLDIGAESSRPGAEPVGQEEELRRLLPVVTEVCRRLSVPVSVDTVKAEVAKQALEAGAHLINDITALRGDPKMAEVVARSGAGLVLMHMQGTPATMQRAPAYVDVLGEIRQYLAERMAVAEQAGIDRKHILLDPGIGFGKNPDHNLEILGRLDALLDLGRPLLVGVSRKAFIGQILGRAVDQRLFGTAGAVAVAVWRGARVLRVHEVRAMREVARVAAAIAAHA